MGATDQTATVTARIPMQLRGALDALTKSTGRNKNALIEEAIRRFVEVEQWQLGDIEEGLREADTGDFATDEEMEALRAKYRAYREEAPAEQRAS